VVFVGPSCKGAYKCPSGSCSADPTACTGEPDVGKQDSIRDFSFVVSKRYRNKQIDFNVEDSSNRGIAKVEFPPNTLLPGWRVSITKAEESKSDDEAKDCGKKSSSKSKKEASTPFDIQVTNADGKEVSNFGNSFKLSLFASIGATGDTKHACLGYWKGKGDSKRCDDSSFKLKKTSSDSVYLVEAQVDHLTSFAVLLGDPGSNDGDCGWNWISIASLTILGSSFLLVISIVFAYCFSGRFRAVVTGSNEKRELSKLKKIIAAPERVRTIETTH